MNESNPNPLGRSVGRSEVDRTERVSLSRSRALARSLVDRRARGVRSLDARRRHDVGSRDKRTERDRGRARATVRDACVVCTDRAFHSYITLTCTKIVSFCVFFCISGLGSSLCVFSMIGLSYVPCVRTKYTVRISRVRPVPSEDS